MIRQESEAGHRSISKMCQLLGVSRATYYRKINPIPAKRVQEQDLLDQCVFQVYHKSDRVYGAGEIRYLLAQNSPDHKKISGKRVQKFMKRQGLNSVTIKKFKVGKASKRMLKDYKNLLKQDFSTTNLNQKWVANITYIHTLADGWCDLSTIMILHSIRIIGYQLFLQP